MGFLVTTLIFVVMGVIATLCARICCNKGTSTNLKPCLGYKLKELSGSKIFSADSEDDVSEAGAVNSNFNNRTSLCIV